HLSLISLKIKELCPPKTNGFLVREIASSSTFYYSCNENFIPSTGGKLHCQIPDIPNSKAVSQNDMKITCNHGYILVGTNTIKCTNGEWETPLPECKLDPASCGPPPRADNAIVKILCQKIFMEESRVNYECRKTFVMDGPNEITCKNGIWTTPPICKLMCSLRTNLTHSIVSFIRMFDSGLQQHDHLLHTWSYSSVLRSTSMCIRRENRSRQEHHKDLFIQ
uniref:Sushi domain-containing protein n=1 Tax=Esox lucius TaxID=8010 RepID=A0AAY5KZ31_ESOLU